MYLVMATMCHLFMTLFCAIIVQFSNIVGSRSVQPICSVSSDGVRKIAKLCLRNCTSGMKNFQNDLLFWIWTLKPVTDIMKDSGQRPYFVCTIIVQISMLLARWVHDLLETERILWSKHVVALYRTVVCDEALGKQEGHSPVLISSYSSKYLTNLMHKICFAISFISCLYMFRAHVLETCTGMK